jgi:large conductance mechanosensitive channel
MIKEFKEFIANGSVMDAAIGFVLGLTFKAVVDSVVNDILMPLVGYLTAGIDFTNLKIVLKQASDGAEEVALTYGQLIQSIITFLIVAFFLFIVMKAVNKLRRQKAEEAEAKEAEPQETDTDILKDIRRLLDKENP